MPANQQATETHQQQHKPTNEQVPATPVSIKGLCQPAALDVFRHIIGQVAGCIRLAALRVTEKEGIVVPGVAQQVQAGRMLLLSLTTEPCNGVWNRVMCSTF